MTDKLTIDRIEDCDIISWFDLTETEQAEFEWLDTEDRQEQAQFVRYNGWTYCTDQFMRIGEHSPFPRKWQGYHGDSAFSGVLIRFTDDDGAILATYYS